MKLERERILMIFSSRKEKIGANKIALFVIGGRESGRQNGVKPDRPVGCTIRLIEVALSAQFLRFQIPKPI